MASRRPKVFVVVNTVTPYTSALYAAVTRRGSVDLMVLYCSQTHRNRPEGWRNFRRGYVSEVLSGVHLYVRGDARDPYHLNLSIIRLIAKRHPDVLVIHGYGDPTNLLVISFARIAGIPYVLSIDGGDIRSTPRIAQYMVRSMVRGARAFTVGGSSAEKLLLRYGAPRERLFPLLVATDLQDIHSMAMSLRMESASRLPVQRENTSGTILFVGRLVPEKGVLDLIGAFRRLHHEDRDLRLVIVGRGPLKEELQKATQGMIAGSVVFIDHLQEVDFIRTLSTSGVLVLPSHNEPLGIVSLEAFVAGIPVVLSDVCGSVGTLPDSPWVTIFPAGNIESLTLSIRKALNLRLNGLESGHLSQIRDFLKENSLDRQAEAFEAAIRTALQTCSSPANRAGKVST